MRYSQEAIDDLLSPLRYVNLKQIDPDSINRIGEGVFPELTTLDHLSLLDLVTKSYQAVHLPTYGKPIPQSTNAVTAVLSTTEQTLITANDNETLEILSISVPGGTSESMSAAGLYLYNLNSLTSHCISDLPRIDDLTVSFNGLVYGHLINYTLNDKAIAAPGQPLYLTGGESLSIKTKSAPDNNITFTVVYRKIAQ